MIRARIAAGFAPVATRLAGRAQAIAQAAATDRQGQIRSDPARWRSARLLWPLFWKG